MKKSNLKKCLSLIVVCVLILAFGMFALGSTSDDEDNTVVTQKGNNVDPTTTNNNALGDYSVEIKSCRMAKDFKEKDVVIVTYAFTNVNDNDSASFSVAIDDKVYQNGIGLNQSYFVDDSYNYNSDNSTKEIKKGASIDVEVAYELNDTTSAIDVEVKERFSMNDKIITKQFELNWHNNA